MSLFLPIRTVASDDVGIPVVDPKVFNYTPPPPQPEPYISLNEFGFFFGRGVCVMFCIFQMSNWQMAVTLMYSEIWPAR